MSFANETRTALAEMYIKKECCELSFLWGLLHFGGDFSRRRIRFTSKCSEVTSLVSKLLDKFFAVYGGGIEWEEADARGYSVILSAEDSDRIFEVYHCREEGTPLSELNRIFRCPTCASMFCRGVFLAAGNLSSPESSYHLDITVGGKDSALPLAVALSDFLTEQGPEPKLTIRKDSVVLYYKESERIEDFLTLIGANKAVFTLMNEKIVREVRNNVNRMNNSELANMKRVANAAGTQLDSIDRLVKSGKITHLPEELQYTAKLRRKNPEATLAELAALHRPALTKSGLNHRLKKLIESAADLQ